jgi:hypothetical protein
MTLSLSSLLACLSSAAGAQQGGLALRYPPTTRARKPTRSVAFARRIPIAGWRTVSSSDVRAWVSAQNAVTEGYLAALPRRKEIADRLGGFMQRRVTHPPFAGGERIFFRSEPAATISQWSSCRITPRRVRAFCSTPTRSRRMD